MWKILINISLKRLFLLQDVKELHNPTQSSRSWIKYLQSAVDHLNNTETQMIGMKPIDAIKLKRVKLHVKPYPPEKILPADGLYSYLYKPGELEHDTQKRATDMNWMGYISISIELFRIQAKGCYIIFKMVLRELL